jgi:hypothetical protein
VPSVILNPNYNKVYFYMQSSMENRIQKNIESSPFLIQREDEWDSFPLSAVWGITGGAIMIQALNDRVTWPFYLTFPLPLLSLLIPGCKAKLSIKERASSYAESLFSLEGLGVLSSFGFGITSANILSHHIVPLDQDSFSDQQQKYFLLFQGSLIIIHFLARYACYSEILKNKHVKINEENKDISSLVVNKSGTEKTRNILLQKETERLNALNCLMDTNYQMLRDFIDDDPLLLKNFEICYKKTQNIFLKPYIMNDFNADNDQIIRKWRQAEQLFQYRKKIFVCLKEFFDKNSEFYNLLEKKIYENGLEKKFLPILNNEMILLNTSLDKECSFSDS